MINNQSPHLHKRVRAFLLSAMSLNFAFITNPFTGKKIELEFTEGLNIIMDSSDSIFEQIYMIHQILDENDSKSIFTTMPDEETTTFIGDITTLAKRGRQIFIKVSDKNKLREVMSVMGPDFNIISLEDFN